MTNTSYYLFKWNRLYLLLMIWTAIFVVFAINGLKNRFRNYSKQPYTFYHIGERGVPKHVWVWTWGQLDSSTPCPGWNVETERVTINCTIIFVYPPKKVSKGAFLSFCNFLFSRNSYIISINYGSYKGSYTGCLIVKYIK